MDVLYRVLDAESVVPVALLSDLGRFALREAITDSSEVDVELLKKVWFKLHLTACTLSIGDRAVTAACNVLTVFLTCARSRQENEVREFIYSGTVWKDTFGAAHRAFESGKNKPALQVIEALISSLKNSPKREIACAYLYAVIKELLNTLVAGQLPLRVKEACIILTCFLRKATDIVPLERYLECFDQQMRHKLGLRCSRHGIFRNRFDVGEEDPMRLLLLVLLLNTQSSEPRTSALKLFSCLCSENGAWGHVSNISAASAVIEVYLDANAEALAEFCTVIFPAILNENSQYQSFMKHHNPLETRSSYALELYLAILQIGREKTFITETDLLQVLDTALWPGIVASSDRSTSIAFDSLLTSLTPRVRLQTHKLLTTSTTTISKVPKDVLCCVLSNSRHLHDDTDAFYRDEFVSNTRKFLNRLERSASSEIRRSKALTAHAKDQHEQYDDYAAFVSQYATFLISEMSPQVSYSRHITSLRVFKQLLNLDGVRELLIGWDSILQASICPLLNLILDPFEDVRSLGYFILEQIGKIDSRLIRTELVEHFFLLRSTILAATTTRSDHSDGLGRLYCLSNVVGSHKDKDETTNWEENTPRYSLNNLIKMTEISIREETIEDMSSGFALHGTILGIAYCIETKPSIDQHFASRIIDICAEIWHNVFDALCTDSPEQTTEEGEEIDARGPKDLLAYSWRALRDSSLLLQALLRSLLVEGAREIYERCGELCLEQLIELRHRGAFSTVAQTFALCCQQVRVAHQETPRDSPLKRWQKAAFHEIERQASKLTRRSAGIPAIFNGIIDAADSAQFRETVEQLVSIASSDAVLINDEYSDVRLPQVHALNCLKDITTNSKFRTITEPLLVGLLNLAARRMSSGTWAIRNCGLMLLRACIDRLSPELLSETSYASVKMGEAFSKTPFTLAMEFLQGCEQDDMSQTSFNLERQSETVFAALHLLAKTQLQQDTEGWVEDLFSQKMDNPLWLIREYAAELRAATCPTQPLLTFVQNLVSHLQHETSTHKLHGVLLCCRFMFEVYWTSERTETQDDEAIEALQIAVVAVQNCQSKKPYPFIWSTYLDILNSAFRFCLSQPSLCEKLLYLSHEVLKSSGNDKYITDYLLSRSVALNDLFRFIVARRHYSSDTSENATYDYAQTGIQLGQDADGIEYALRHINTSGVVAPELYDLYVETITSNCSEAIRIQAMIALTTILQSDSASLSLSQLRSLPLQILYEIDVSRDMLDTEIMLAASIISYVGLDDLNVELYLIWSKLLNIMQLSLLNEVEVPSRLNAAHAMGLLVSVLAKTQHLSNSITFHDRLWATMMIYDLLNDDDEEIRDVAAGFTHNLLARTETKGRFFITCASATRHDIIQYTIAEFGDLAIFQECAVGKLLGATPVTGLDFGRALILHMRKFPVQAQIDTIIKRSRDLFVEEKQNLYIDRIAECQAWTICLHAQPLAKLGARTLSTILKWTKEGLTSLLTLLRSDNTPGVAKAPQDINSCRFLRLTYDEDFLVLFVRVIAIAGLVLHSAPNLGESNALEFQALYVDLSRLHEICLEKHVHQQIVDNLQAVLN